MDAQRFIVEFGHIVNAPGGVARLRVLVLALAVQGRLVAQDSSEESADSQLERIKDIASSTPQTGRRKKASSQPSQVLHQSLPQGWANTRLCELMRVLNGRAYSKSELLESGTPVLRVGNLFTSDRWYYSNLELEDDKCCDTGDLLYAWSASFGPFIWSGKRVIFHYHIWKLDLFSEADVNKRFLYLWLLEKTQEIKAAGHGISMAHMTKEKFEQLPLALPPLNEQSRIVAKVDELMALCDRLEAQQQSRRQLQTALRRATLQALAATMSPAELHTAWTRLSETFPRLFAAPEDLEEIRSFVFDLAIKGLLTIGNDSDEPVERLIERSQAAKSSRLASGEMKRKAISATDVVQLDMLLPDHWNAVALDSLFQFIDYRGNTPPKTNSGVVLITAKNIRPGQIRKEPVEHISESSYKQWMTRGFPKMRDILFTTEAPLGNVAVIEQAPNFALAQRIICLQPFADLNTRCAMYFMMSPTFQRLLEANSTGMTAKGIKAAKLKQLRLPLPPIGEQARIVEKVTALMRFCDELASQKRDALALAARLSTAAVSSLTGIAIEQEEEPVKAPKTELFAPLHLGKSPSVKEQAPLAAILAHTQGGLNAKDLWRRYGGEIDAFYAQLKTEVTNGWIREPEPAVMNEIHEDDRASA